MTMKLYLIVSKGSRTGYPIPIPVDLFMIGSEKMCQLRAPKLPPRQCAVVTRDNKVFIRDFNSGEPTLVNDQLLPPGMEWPLHVGDRISVGKLEFMVQFHEKALSQRDLEEWAARCLDKQEECNVLDEAEDDHEAANASEAASQIINKLNVMKGTVKGRLRIGREQGIIAVRFNDTILVEESEISHVKSELCENLDKPNLRVLIDMKNVRRMSSNAMVMLQDFKRWLRPFGSTMAICRVRSELRGPFMEFLNGSIPVFHDKRTAFSARW